MPDSIAQPETAPAIAAPADGPERLSPWGRLRQRANLVSILYVLMLPTIISMVVFSYYPKIDVVIKSFYRWTPGDVEEFVGLKNFLDALADPRFWQSFELVGILLVANLLKMWPGIITAIALHRILSDRWRYIFQVLFVIPMVIPGLVWLLIWKSFYDPDFGILNHFLNGTGLMNVLAWLDGTRSAPGIMPQLAAHLSTIMNYGPNQVFGNAWGVILCGVMLWTLRYWDDRSDKRLISCGLLVAASFLMPVAVAVKLFGASFGTVVFAAVTLAVLVLLARRIGAHWLLWTMWIGGGAIAFHGKLFYLPAMVVTVLAINEVVRAKLDRLTAHSVLYWAGVALTLVGGLLLVLTKIWTVPTEQFSGGAPAWIGNQYLVIPSVIFWGFPWVGTVGVLIYLAGLQQISTDVYEAAELDGVGPISKLFYIELPLIMTQVRINLIFMTIGTLTAYEFFLILLGSSGGPGNKGLVPGLYMYQQAFESGKFGYASSLGMILFVLILGLTVIYQKYVKVEK